MIKRAHLLAASAALAFCIPASAVAATAPFAARLAQEAVPVSAAGWGHGPVREAWEALPGKAKDRQPLRWRIVTARLHARMGYEAVGILAVMKEDEPDIELVPAFRLAEGAAQALIGRASEALAALDSPDLATNPEACLWRMRSLAALGRAEAASDAAQCARPAIAARSGGERIGLQLWAASAALGARRYDKAVGWLSALPDGNATANVLRGKLALAQGHVAAAKLRFERASIAGPRGIKAEARLRLVMLQAPGKKPAALIGPFREALWRARGGGAEREGLDAGIATALAAQDDDSFGEFAAARLRYLAPDAKSAAYRDALVARLSASLAPASKVPLPIAAERMWRYRDLVPGGAQGEAMLYALVARLEGGGLWARAADLLSYRAAAMPRDLERGPISLRIVRNQILAGKPDRAMAALRDLSGIALPDEMAAARDRLEAITLYHLGQRDRARALLQDQPGGTALAAEMAWRAKDWAAIAAIGGSDPDSLLRQAIALAMLGRQQDLDRLAARRSALSGPRAVLFSALTRPSPEGAATAAKALALLDSGPASPDAQLLDAVPDQRR